MTTATAKPSTGAPPLLAVRGVRVRVDGVGDAVHDATFSVAPREILGVVGESGSGKSLTLRAIDGLLPRGVTLAGGSVCVDGVNVTKWGGTRRRRGVRGGTIGMVFQEPMTALNPTMRIGRQITEAVRRHSDLSRKKAAARAVELLEEMDIADPAHYVRAYPHELSGGMCQRVVMAIALGGDPRVLLCDEPTTALDAMVTVRVLELIRRTAEKWDMGVVLVTHDLGVAARICDRIVVMYGGRIMEEGSTEAVLRRPRHPYTFALLRAVPTRASVLADLEAIPGAPPRVGEAAAGCPFMSRCAFARPACQRATSMTEVEPGHLSACWRQELFSDGNGGRGG